jgi:UV DNA damage endonuclease
MRLAAALRSPTCLASSTMSTRSVGSGSVQAAISQQQLRRKISIPIETIQRRYLRPLGNFPRDTRRRLAAAAMPNLETEDEDKDFNNITKSSNPWHCSTESTPLSTLTLGYACDNLTLRRSGRIFTNRSCHKGTFTSRGLDHVSKLALNNCRDLTRIIQWNHENGVQLFRVSSKIFPWSGQYELEALPDFEEISAALAAAGELARSYGQRLTNHPPHFIKLASTDEEVRLRSIADLEIQARVFDLMGFPPSHWNKINIHVGGVYGSKPRTLERFAQTFHSLSEAVRYRLAVENDDRPNSYSVTDLLPLHASTGIPITFDFHHHQFCRGGQTQREAFEAAISTWPAGVRPVVHWSEMPECPERQRTHPHAHSAFVYGPIHLYGREADVDVMIESKAKEVALLLYRDEIAPRLALEKKVVLV